MKSLAILGASGHGKVVADIAELCGFNDIKFFDDTPKESNGKWEVAGNTQTLICRIQHFNSVIVAIGNNRLRQQKIDELHALNAQFATLIHPSAVVSRYSKIGHGVVICAHSVINAYSNIGTGTIINTSSTVDHDCTIGNYAHISPGAHIAGGVSIGERSWIGIGACIKQEIKIGNDVIVGAGAAVINNIPDNITVVGIPATQLK